MTAPVTILVDGGELRSGVPRYLEAAGARVRVDSLAVADYLVADGVGVERKTIRDLGRSIVSGRLWAQIAELRTLARPYLVIEGYARPVPGVARPGLRGAVLQISDNRVTVLWAEDPKDTAGWLIQIAKRSRRPVEDDFPPRRRRRPRVTTGVGLLSSVSGVTPATAQQLLETFGSVAAIANASTADLMRIPGLGPKRASHLKHALTTPSLPL